MGGVWVAVWGWAGTYTVDVATYVRSLVAFAGIAPSPPVGDGKPASLTSVLHGLRFLRGHSVIMSVFGIDLLAMIFGMPRALFPALTARLGGGPTFYGILLSSVAAGAFVASITIGWTGRVRRQGRAVVWAVLGGGPARALAGPTTPAGPVPACADDNIWLGPAPERPFNPNRFHYNWHWFWDFGNGDIGNQGVHELGICRWAMGDPAWPNTAVAQGARYAYDDDQQAPQTLWHACGFGVPGRGRPVRFRRRRFSLAGVS